MARHEEHGTGFPVGAAVGMALFGALGLATLFGGYFTVGERERAVVTRNGKFQYVAGPGLHFKLPFIDSAHDIDVGLRSFGIEDSETYSRDSQVLLVDMVVQYEVPDTQVEQVFRELKDPEQRLKSMALDRMKRVLGTRNAWDVPANRAEVAAAVLESIKPEAERLYGLKIVDVQLPDISYTKAFREAVDLATIEQTKAGRAEAEQKRIAIELQTAQNRARSDAVIAETQARAAAVQRTVAAEAEAKAVELRGRADAENIRLRGAAEAETLKAQNDALTQQGAALVQLRQAERWDGKLPQNVFGFGGGGAGSPALPILHMQGPAVVQASPDR